MHNAEAVILKGLSLQSEDTTACDQTAHLLRQFLRRSKISWLTPKRSTSIDLTFEAAYREIEAAFREIREQVLERLFASCADVFITYTLIFAGEPNSLRFDIPPAAQSGRTLCLRSHALRC
jgi:hypothetical protein